MRRPATSGFVYVWYDRKHNMYYIGSHWGSPDDGYVCSSPWMLRAYRKRPDDFKRRIVKTITTTRLELLSEEQRWLDMIKPEEIRFRYYNLNRRLVGHWWTDDQNRKTIKQKISEGTRTAMQRPDVRSKYEQGLKTRKQPHANTAWREQIRQTCLAQNLNKGKLTVRYPGTTQCFHITTDDPRWLNGELETARGYKRKPREKKGGNKTGAEHHMFSGVYHTPWGKFMSAGEAASNCPYGPIVEDVIWKWCKRDSDQVFAKKGRPPKILQPDWMGKTRREIGFWFEPK